MQAVEGRNAQHHLKVHRQVPSFLSQTSSSIGRQQGVSIAEIRREARHMLQVQMRESFLIPKRESASLNDRMRGQESQSSKMMKPILSKIPAMANPKSFASLELQPVDHVAPQTVKNLANNDVNFLHEPQFETPQNPMLSTQLLTFQDNLGFHSHQKNRLPPQPAIKKSGGKSKVKATKSQLTFQLNSPSSSPKQTPMRSPQNQRNSPNRYSQGQQQIGENKNSKVTVIDLHTLYISPTKNGAGKVLLRSPDTEMKYLKMKKAGAAETHKRSPYMSQSPQMHNSQMQFPDIKYQSSVIESVPSQEQVLQTKTDVTVTIQNRIIPVSHLRLDHLQENYHTTHHQQSPAKRDQHKSPGSPVTQEDKAAASAVQTFGSMNAAILQSSAGPFNHQVTTKISIENYTPISEIIDDFKLVMKGKGGSAAEQAQQKKEIKFIESKGLVFVKNYGAPQPGLQLSLKSTEQLGELMKLRQALRTVAPPQLAKTSHSPPPLLQPSTTPINPLFRPLDISISGKSTAQLFHSSNFHPPRQEDYDALPSQLNFNNSPKEMRNKKSMYASMQNQNKSNNDSTSKVNQASYLNQYIIREESNKNNIQRRQTPQMAKLNHQNSRQSKHKNKMGADQGKGNAKTLNKIPSGVTLQEWGNSQRSSTCELDSLVSCQTNSLYYQNSLGMSKKGFTTSNVHQAIDNMIIENPMNEESIRKKEVKHHNTTDSPTNTNLRVNYFTPGGGFSHVDRQSLGNHISNSNSHSLKIHGQPSGPVKVISRNQLTLKSIDKAPNTFSNINSTKLRQ